MTLVIRKINPKTRTADLDVSYDFDSFEELLKALKILHENCIDDFVTYTVY